MPARSATVRRSARRACQQRLTYLSHGNLPECHCLALVYVDRACYAGCVLEEPRARDDLAERDSVFLPGIGEPGGCGASACGFGGCTRLYAAVRGIGGGGAYGHVHIVDSVPAASVRDCHFLGQRAYGGAGRSGL